MLSTSVNSPKVLKAEITDLQAQNVLIVPNLGWQNSVNRLKRLLIFNLHQP
jgi:hypothetical protein